MIPAITRILLIVSSSIAFLYVVSQIRHSNLTIRDSIFWVILSIILIFMAIFPDIIGWISGLFGFISASNLVFISIIAIMIVRIYRMSIQISSLNTKIKELTQSIAIQEYETEEKIKSNITK